MFRPLQWLQRRRLERRGFFVFRDDLGRLRAVDPWRTARELMNHPRFNLDTMLEPALDGSHSEAELLAEAVCEVFSVRRWNEAQQAGLQDGELVGLLMNFEAFSEQQKKNISPGPISSPATESASSMDSPTPPVATEPYSLGSGSTPVGSIVVGPGTPCGACEGE